MTEILWISLPLEEKNALKNVISLIESKNLANLSINELIEKLEKNKAAGWLEVLSQYNSTISAVNNMNTSNKNVLSLARSVRDKFRERGYEALENRVFPPNQLLSLIITGYASSNLIGPKLCRALSDNNEIDVKKEILENSARVGNRVSPWASNLRLASCALHLNDTDIKLPVNVVKKVKSQTIEEKLSVTIKDFQADFQEVIDGNERASRVARSVNIGWELSSYQFLKNLQDEELIFESGQFVRDLPFVKSSSFFVKSSGVRVSPPSLNGMLVSSLAFFYLAKQIPIVAPVIRNVSKDIKGVAEKLSRIFFQKNAIGASPQNEERSLVLPSAKR